jgi:hypothetical protein
LDGNINNFYAHARIRDTGTCFIQKIYAPSSSFLKEEERAYIFGMKQVLVIREPL